MTEGTVSMGVFQTLVGTKDALWIALEGMTKRYVDLVNCGDCGNWDPEEEAEVKLARAAISRAEKA